MTATAAAVPGTPALLPRLTALGKELDTSPAAFGTLRRSAIDLIDDVPSLRARMQEDGYLYLPGYLDSDEVLAARRAVTDRLAADGLLDDRYPSIEAVAGQGVGVKFKPDLAHDNAPLHTLLYTGRMMDFYEKLLGGPVRHFDYTWMRAVAPGTGTAPHCDIVFMGRGTTNLYTSWTPLGDISLEIGGVMILENSHKHERLRSGYGTKDVDEVCTNHNIGWGGHLTQNPVRLRERFGGRWLTNEYRAGDLLVFSMFTVHGSLDNQSDRIRLSSDTRYQLASDPVDERWIGPAPIAHGPAAKRGRIC